MVEFVGELAGEAQANDPAVDAGDARLPMAAERRKFPGAGAREQPRRPGSGDVDRRQRGGLVQDPDVAAESLGPVAQPQLEEAGPAGGRGHEEAVAGALFRLPAEHPVVEEIAALVQHEDVAAATGTDRRDSGGDDPFQERFGVRPGDRHLAERTHVAERDALAHGAVLVVLLAVGPGPPPTAGAVHSRPEPEVLVVERRAGGHSGVCAGGQLPHGQLPVQRSGGERGLKAAPSLQQEAAQVRQANAALAGASTGERRALEQLHLVEAALPDAVQVGDGDVAARADRALPGAGRQLRFDRGAADHPHRQVRGHPRQRVSWIAAKAEDRGVAFDALFGRIGVAAFSQDDRLDPSVALEADEFPAAVAERKVPGEGAARPFAGRLADDDGAAQVDAGGDKLRGCPRGDQSLQVAAGNDRLDLRGARGDDDLPPWVDVEHPPAAVRRDDQRPGIDPGDVLPVSGVQGDDAQPRLSCFPLGLPARVALSDDDRVAVDMAHGRGASGRHPLVGQQGRFFVADMLARHPHAGLGLHLTTPRVSDAIDRHEAVRAVLAEAHATSASGMQAGPQHGEEQTFARVGLDRLPVDQESRHSSGMLRRIRVVPRMVNGNADQPVRVRRGGGCQVRLSERLPPTLREPPTDRSERSRVRAPPPITSQARTSSWQPPPS